MPKPAQRIIKNSPSKRETSPGKNVFLALTLVPLVIGIILVGAWVLDIELLENSQSQVTVGIFFFLLTFTASNAIQNRWQLASGWGLLALADIVSLAWLNVVAQVVALSTGLAGVILLGIEFYKQYQLGKTNKAKK